jgi:hypothetical protein
LPIEQNPWIDECRDNNEPSKKKAKSIYKKLAVASSNLSLKHTKKKKKKERKERDF